jgi:hypothetical protein
MSGLSPSPAGILNSTAAFSMATASIVPTRTAPHVALDEALPAARRPRPEAWLSTHGLPSALPSQTKRERSKLFDRGEASKAPPLPSLH